jgi:tight adherence protein C
MYIEQSDVLIFLITFAVFFAVFLLINRYRAKDAIKKRILGKSEGSAQEGGEEKKIELFAPVASKFAEELSKIFGQKEKETLLKKYRNDFEQAGWNSYMAPVKVIIGKIILSVCFMLGALFLVNSIKFLHAQSFSIQLIVVLAAALLGSMSFDWIVKFFIQRRYRSISQDIGNGLDLLVVCSSSGINIDRAFEMIAQELYIFNPELSREFALTAIELNIIPDRSQAYHNLAKRIQLPIMKGLATTLVQAEEQGSSISETLRILSNESRDKLIIAAETKAAKLPAILTIPVVALTLPALMIIVMSPVIIKALRVFNL